jgi:hypothetical protein
MGRFGGQFLPGIELSFGRDEKSPEKSLFMSTRNLICLGMTLVMLMVARITFAQTQINLQSQGRDVDFSAAPSTKPAQTGALLPVTCSTGAVFVSLSNPPGQNVYICTSSNVWSLQANGGGAAPNVLGVSAVSSALSIGANCTSTSPCNVRVGSTVFAFTYGMTATISGGSGSAYVYVSSAGVLTVGHSMTVSCAGGCVAQSGITGFPSDSYPIALWTASDGIWNQSGVDTRAPLGRDLVVAGNGLLSNSSGLATSLSAPPHEAGFGVAFRGTDVTAGQTLYLTMPYACTITDWTITSDGAATIMLWRIPDGGTNLPDNSATLNTNGFAITNGTRIHSTVLTDLSSTSIFAFDTFGINLFAAGSSASHVEFYLGCAR